MCGWSPKTQRKKTKPPYFHSGWSATEAEYVWGVTKLRQARSPVVLLDEHVLLQLLLFCAFLTWSCAAACVRSVVSDLSHFNFLFSVIRLSQALSTATGKWEGAGSGGPEGRVLARLHTALETHWSRSKILWQIMPLSHWHGSVCSLSNTHYIINNNSLWLHGYKYFVSIIVWNFKHDLLCLVVDMSPNQRLGEPCFAAGTTCEACNCWPMCFLRSTACLCRGATNKSISYLIRNVFRWTGNLFGGVRCLPSRDSWQKKKKNKTQSARECGTERE